MHSTEKYAFFWKPRAFKLNKDPNDFHSCCFSKQPSARNPLAKAVYCRDLNLLTFPPVFWKTTVEKHLQLEIKTVNLNRLNLDLKAHINLVCYI